MGTPRHGQAVAAWIRGAKTNAIPESVRLAKGLEADWAAVHAGLTESWSQGMTKEFNNQIQCLKRIMFGRADFDLLRARILHNQS
jgi:transposase